LAAVKKMTDEAALNEIINAADNKSIYTEEKSDK
jgi:hypothetical protein